MVKNPLMIKIIKLRLRNFDKKKKRESRDLHDQMFMIKCKHCVKENQRNKNECPAQEKNIFKLQKKRTISGGKKKTKS